MLVRLQIGELPVAITRLGMIRLNFGYLVRGAGLPKKERSSAKAINCWVQRKWKANTPEKSCGSRWAISLFHLI